MINLFLISDNELLNDNIKSWIKADNGVKLLGAASKSMASVRNIKEMNPDLIAVDLTTNDSAGIELIKCLNEINCTEKILVMYSSGSEESLFRIYEEGIRGFLVKETGKEDFVIALKKLSKDKKFICTELALVMLQKLNDRASMPMNKNASVDISKREMEVLHLIGDGFTNHEIANKLFTSRRTVETHRKNYYQGDVMVDGGLVANFPIHTFDYKKYLTENGDSTVISNPESLGLRLDKEAQIRNDKKALGLAPVTIISFKTYVEAFYNIIIENLNRQNLTEADWQRTISINTADIGPKIKHMSEKEKNLLIDSGKKGVIEYFENKSK